MGQRVVCKCTILNRQATVEVVPAMSNYIIRALKEPLRDRKKEKDILHHGNITMDEVVEIARLMAPRSMSATLKGVVLECLGTCRSMGCTIDGMSPAEATAAVKSGEVEVPEESL